MAEDTLTRAEEDALARARRSVRAATPRNRAPARGSAGRRRGGSRGRTGRSSTLDLARGAVLCLTVTLLLVEVPGGMPAPFRPAGGDGFGVADLLPATLTVLVGVSMSWQLAAHRTQSSAWWAGRLGRRVAVLVAVGIGLAWLRDPDGLRVTGPLVRLALGGAVAWFLVTRLAPRVQAAVGCALLLGHTVLLARGVLGADGAVSRLEAHLMDGRLQLPVDPDGLTALAPTVVAIVAGVWMGRWLRHRPVGLTTVLALGLAGGYAAGAGLALAQFLPVNATLWTASTVLLGMGVTFFVLSLAHLVADVLPGAARAVRWATAVGAEALPVYVLAVGLAVALDRTPLGSVRHGLTTALAEPLVGGELAAMAVAALLTTALARLAAALTDRGWLIRA